MSDNNELSLLGEDLGDDDYDLGNEDEDALLADDYDLQRESYISDGQDTIENQTEYVEYEEPLEDDVLDLEVTDALDDLDSEIQESTDDSTLAKKQCAVLEQSNVMKKKDSFDFHSDCKPTNVQVSEGNASIDTNTHLESEEEEEGGEGEGRGRFKSERTNIVSLKSGKTYGNIPDSLDQVIPADENNAQKPPPPQQQQQQQQQPQQHKRDGNQWRNRRGRGNGPRGGSRQHFHSKQQPPPHFQGPVFSPGPAPGAFVRHPLPPQQLQHHHHHHLQHQPPQMQHHPHPQSGPPSQPGHHPMSQASQQQMQQPPHKILINPHFRGAVQPHPEARLIWDNEPLSQPPGDGLLPFPPRVFVDSPYPSTPQGNYEHSFQHHDPVVFHNSVPSQHQQIPHPQPPNQNYYPGEMYVEHPPSQPPLSQPIHQQSHQNAPNVEYWHDMQPPHPPNQIQGPPPHGRDNFYPPPDVFNPPQFSGPGPVSSQDQQSFSVHLDQVSAPPQPAVWQGAASDTMQIPVSQVTAQQFPSTQGVFRLVNPPPGHGPGSGPGPGPRFRQPANRNFRNFPPQRPRFSGPMNGPHVGRRHSGPLQHGPGQAPQQSPPDIQSSKPQPQSPNFRSPQKRPSFEGGNSNVVSLTQGRFDPAPKRKKRMPDMSNLHEVQTVDTLPTQVGSEGQDENEDEETREYRKKIEEQKRLRERILQQKEARRKLAALEKQRELQKKDIDLQAGGDATSCFAAQSDPPQGNAIATIVNRNTVEPQTVSVRQQAQTQLMNRGTLPEVSPEQMSLPVMKQRATRGRVMRGRGRGIGRGQFNNNLLKQSLQSQLQTSPQKLQPQQQLQQSQQQLQQPQLQQQQLVQVVPVQGGTSTGQRIVRSTLRPAALQKTGQGTTPTAPPKRVVLNQGTQRLVQVSAPRTVTLRGTNSTKLTASQISQQKPPQVQRRVVQTQQSRPPNSVPGRTVISNQNTSITVMAQAPEVAAMPRTKLVAVENLAASTTDSQLRRMCQRVGIVENIQMIPAQRRAVITFSNPASAITFFKRYQRKMVDLSLISVKLLTS